MAKYPNMLSPMSIGNVKFKNRVLASPVTTGRLTTNGYPAEDAIAEYADRAKGGFAAVTFTETFVDDDYAARYGHGIRIWEGAWNGDIMEHVQLLTERIHSFGAIASIQLNHAGGANHPDTIRDHKNPIGPSGYIREDGVRVDEMSLHQMEEVAEHFAEAAYQCKRLGFDMVMLHGGHGWLLHQFMSSTFNKRNDEFGGNVENRARFPRMVLSAIKKRCGKDFPIEYRISGAERIPNGMTLEETVEFCLQIEDLVDLFHVTSGLYFNHVQSKSFSSMFDEHGCNLDLAEAIKREVHVPVVAVGGFNSPEQIERAIASEKCDFVALGRQQLADPYFVKKCVKGEEKLISPCLRCSCFNPLPPDTSERPAPPVFKCAVNPRAGRVRFYNENTRTREPKRIVVIGGGVAGMYAAFTAAEQGHIVELYEKTDRLGGVLWYADIDSHKESLKRFKDSLISRCKKAGVLLHLSENMTPEKLTKLQPDVVICAVGSRISIPQIPGITYAMSAMEAYNNLACVGEKAVIIGGGLVGCELGLLLGETGRRITILEVGESVARDALYSHRLAMLPRLEAVAELKTGISVTEIWKGGVTFKDSDQQEQTIENASIIYATGMRPNEEEVKKLSSTGARFITIGDCNSVRQLKDACYEGLCAVYDLD